MYERSPGHATPVLDGIKIFSVAFKVISRSKGLTPWTYIFQVERRVYQWYLLDASAPSMTNLTKWSERIKHAPFWGPPFRVTVCPLFPGRGKRAIHAGDSVEVVGLPRETGRFPVSEKGKFPFGKRGAKATQNGNHNSVHVWFSLKWIERGFNFCFIEEEGAWSGTNYPQPLLGNRQKCTCNQEFCLGI